MLKQTHRHVIKDSPLSKSRSLRFLEALKVKMVTLRKLLKASTTCNWTSLRFFTFNRFCRLQWFWIVCAGSLKWVKMSRGIQIKNEWMEDLYRVSPPRCEMLNISCFCCNCLFLHSAYQGFLDLPSRDRSRGTLILLTYSPLVLK